MDRYLILENGKSYKGEAFGYSGDVVAEIVFTTAMTGYLETLTDKSYKGQAVVQTFPLIGNYGIITPDREGPAPSVSAYIVREVCEAPSNFRCEMTLDDYLKESKIVGIKGLDTRALTKVLRESGTMNGIITDDPSKVNMDEIKKYRITNPVDEVTVKEVEVHNPEEKKFTVAMLDYGTKDNIVRSLVNRGCEVHLFPANTSVSEIYEINPDGIFLSNGPGDPEDNTEAIATLKALTEGDKKIPMMGICLGHQLLALAHGFKTSKLKYGHRGANHPVKNLETGRIYISSQNHGYAVIGDSIDSKVAKELFVNGNDGTNEGIRYLNYPAYSVQFHPEACGGPKDTDFLFDEFISMMTKGE